MIGGGNENQGFFGLMLNNEPPVQSATFFFDEFDLSEDYDLQFDSALLGDYNAKSVAFVDDVNGDGFDDAMVGSPKFNNGSVDVGRAYLYYGGPAGFDFASPNATFTGTGIARFVGYSVASAGDVNADGYADILIGAIQTNSYAGEAYLIYGNGSANLISGQYLLSTDANATFVGTAGSYTGNCVAPAGDVNGDGYSDFIIGSARYNSNRGRVYVFYGNDSANLIKGTYNLGTAGVANATFTGVGSTDLFGYSVDGIGDTNNDTFDDIIIGAIDGSSYSGSAYIYKGSASGLELSAAVTFVGSSSHLGNSVSGAGDVNGDGFDDFMIGEFFYSGETGRARLYYGSSSLSFPSANATFTGASTSNRAGTCVCGAGDLNKDGFGDILISAPGYNSQQGKVYGFFGAGGSSTLQGNYNLDSGSNITFVGIADHRYTGTFLAGGGDCSADGWDDVMISACQDMVSYGDVYCFFGENSHLLSFSPNDIACVQGSNTTFSWQVIVTGPGSMEFDASILIDAELFMSFVFMTDHTLNYSTSLSFLPVGNHTMTIIVTSALGDPVQGTVNVTVTSNASAPGFLEIIEPYIIPSLASFGVGIAVFAITNFAVTHRKSKKDVRKKKT